VFLAAVFAVKAATALQLDQHPLLSPDSGLDTAAHLALARRVLAGDVLLGPGLYYMSPLYTYFLAAALFVRDSITFVRVFQAALGTLAVGCVMLTAREWFGARAGWIAGIIAALAGEFTFHEILIQQSALDTILTAAPLLFLTLALDAPEPGLKTRPTTTNERGLETRPATTSAVGRVFSPAAMAVAAGLLFGLATLNRPNMGLAVAVIVAVALFGRRWRVAAAIALGALCCLAPVVARNAIVSHEFALLSSQGGLNFYIGNNPSATGQYVSLPGVRSNIEGQSEDARRVASQALGRPVSDAEGSAYFSGMAFRWMRANPAAAAGLFVKKLLLVFNWRHQWLDYSYPYYAHDVDSPLRALVAGPWLIVPLGLAGLAVLGLTASIPSFRIWAAFVPAYAVAVAVFFVAERYRLPLLIALCVPAGALADRLVDIRKRPESGRAMIAAALAASCAIAFWPFHLQTGQFEERLRLSKVLMNRADFDGAARALQAAYELRPDDLVTEFNLGTALVSGERPGEGIEHMRHAVAGGVAIPGARYAFAGALLAAGDNAGAGTLIQSFTPDSGDDADSCYHVALLAIHAREIETARRYLGRALQLRPGWADAEQALEQISSK
jgi:tetratricopeptide (TPR) repeat protein